MAEHKEASPLNPSGLTCHAWNADASQVAISLNGSTVNIYEAKGKDDYKNWKLLHTLEQHAGFVSGIDWSPVTNQIVTCGHDRNAYVWKYDDAKKEWVPTLVILRINRAATMVKWSPAGNKFAVTSGAKCVPVCHFEEGNNWWISKMIKKHKSTVMCLDWCVNNKFIVTGSTDFKCRIFSAYIEGIDSAEDDGFGAVWGNQHEFGEVLSEFDAAKAWVTSVAWSPSAFRIAFGGHGSSIHFVQILAGQKLKSQDIDLKGLPFLDMVFADNNTVVAAGFDCNPTVFTAAGSDEEPDWSLKEVLDKPKKAGEKKVAAKSSAFAASRNLFSNAADKGSSFGAKEKRSAILTFHTNSIVSLAKVAPEEGKFASRISSAGIDGRFKIWDFKTLDCAKDYAL